MNDTTASPEALRAAMVERILAGGWARRGPVTDAMLAVPRHLFVPDAPVPDAYDDRAVIIKRDPSGAALSCASEPAVVAMMLEQLDVHPGDNVLEIGAGTGYNAALLAHLTGPDGQVTTIDIDPDVTTHTRRTLHTNGFTHVRVLTRDGALGDPDNAPYDRIILTVGAWDLAPAWSTQLAPTGRLVIPLRWRGQTRSVAFTHTDTALRSESVQLCGFVPIVGQDGERSAALDPDGHVTLTWDADQPIDPVTLLPVLHQPKATMWSAVTVAGDEPFDGIWLRLTGAEPGTCRITADSDAVNTGLCTPAIPSRSPALANRDSLAYLTLRRGDADAGWELGASGHGPNATDLAERIRQQIHAWDQHRTATPTITAHAPGASHTHAIHKPHTTLTVAY